MSDLSLAALPTRRTWLGQVGAGILGLSLVRCAHRDIIPLTTGVDLSFITPVGEHYVKNGAEGALAGWRTPDLDRDGWRLAINGRVEQVLSVSYEDLRADAAHAITVMKTMQCVVDSATAQGLVGTALWRGVPLALYLERAGIVRGGSARLRLYGADGFTNNLPLSRIYDRAPDVPPPLLVTEMNGAPLTRDHGAPARLIVADAFGYACVKWLVRVEVTAEDTVFGTYQDSGFTDESVSPVISKITTPVDNLTVPAGVVSCTGFAVSGEAPVSAVEVRIDGGPWLPVEVLSREEALDLMPEIAEAVQVQQAEAYGWPLKGVWVLWRFAFEAAPGRYLLEVRAADAAGGAQPERDIDISDGVSAISAIRIQVSE